MSITYKVKSLNELAAHFEMKAQELRQREYGRSDKQKDKQRHIGEAYAYESIAHILRNTIIEP